MKKEEKDLSLNYDNTSFDDYVKVKKVPVAFKIFILRWWSAGAIYFFIGMGTDLGLDSNYIILLPFMLAIVMGIANKIVFDRIVDEYFLQIPIDSEYVKDYLKWLKAIVKVGLLIVFIIFIYYLLDLLLVQTNILKKLGTEPIFYGLFYAVGDLLFNRLRRKINGNN